MEEAVTADMAGGKLAAVRSCDENKGGRLNGSVCDSMSRISWQSHNPTYPGDTDLRISYTCNMVDISCGCGDVEWCHIYLTIPCNVFSLTSGDWMTASTLTPTPLVCGRGAEMTLMVSGECHGLLSSEPSISVSIRNNDVRSTCPVSLSSVVLMTISVAGRCLSLTQAPITDHLHWPYIIGLLLLTTHHQTWRPGVIEHCQHQHGARRHRTETLAPSMQTPHRNPLNIHRIQIRYISSGYY